MSNDRFELAENWQGNNATANDAYLALHNESFSRANIVPVADKQTIGEKGKQSDTVVPADQPTTKAGKMLDDAIQIFEKAGKDPVKALAASESKFQAAVKQSDDDFAPTMKSLEAQAQKLAPEYKKAEAAIAAADANLQTKFQQVPEKDQTKVESMLQTWAQLAPNNQVRQAINKELAKYPGLVQAAEGMEKAANAPAINQMESLKKQAETAVEDRVTSRMTYAEALKAAGRDDDAQKQVQDAAKILGMDAPDQQDKKLPKGMLRAEQLGSMGIT